MQNFTELNDADLEAVAGGTNEDDEYATFVAPFNVFP